MGRPRPGRRSGAAAADPAATAAEYTLADADIGKRLRVVVTARNAAAVLVMGAELGLDLDDLAEGLAGFGGVGPARTGCLECGACMTGCRWGAKNTLVKNYLYLAERAGAEVHPMTTVTAVRPAWRGGYLVETRHTGRPWRRPRHRPVARTRPVPPRSSPSRHPRRPCGCRASAP